MNITFKDWQKKHDLVVIHISDIRETSLPGLGIVPLYDNETDTTIWVNTSSKEFKNKIEKNFSQKFSYLEILSRKNQVDYLHIDSKENYIPKLIKLFQVRNKSKKSA